MPVGASLGLGAASFIGGKSDAKKARALQQQQLALQAEQLAFAKKRYAKNEKLYGETKQLLVDAANEGVTADLQGVTDRASADVSQAFEKSRGETDRNLARMGINPNSGRAMAVREGNSVAKAAAESGMINKSRRDEKRYAEDTTWNRRESVSRLGVQESQFDANMVNNSTQNMAQSYGNAADQAQQSASAGYNTAGQFAGMGLSQMFPIGKTTTPAGGTDFSGQMDQIDAANGITYKPESPYNFSFK